MSVRMKVVGFANGDACPIADQYLETFDFEAYDGQGYGTFTFDPAEAMQFADKAAAFVFWNTRSKTRPTRPDGKPNKPLTATTVVIE